MEDVLRKMRAAFHAAAGKSETVLLTSGNVRIHIKRIAERILPNLVVLSHNELPGNVKVMSLGTIG